ncbi:hypothetical protein B0H11DRAFT_2210436 [Mycena galericulata]|nr:hypothetical protein B0H11DRAFT_2210436 [Mycena galericulata]
MSEPTSSIPPSITSMEYASGASAWYDEPRPIWQVALLTVLSPVILPLFWIRDMIFRFPPMGHAGTTELHLDIHGPTWSDNIHDAVSSSCEKVQNWLRANWKQSLAIATIALMIMGIIAMVVAFAIEGKFEDGARGHPAFGDEVGPGVGW